MIRKERFSEGLSHWVCLRVRLWGIALIMFTDVGRARPLSVAPFPDGGPQLFSSGEAELRVALASEPADIHLSVLLSVAVMNQLPQLPAFTSPQKGTGKTN